MDRDDLRTIIKIADYVIKEHPVWVEDALNITEEELKRLREVLSSAKL